MDINSNQKNISNQPIQTSGQSGQSTVEPQVQPSAKQPTEPVQSQASVPQAQEKQGAAMVLLIEDDPLLTKMYKAKFTTEGFNVLVAQDGEEGLKMALENSPDMILLDIMMPKLSGLDLLGKLREDPKGKDIPVIVLTNLTQQKEAQKALDLGAKEFMVKANLTPSQVVEKIKKYLKE
jgi:CheY-like chemotaxis protein